MIHDTKAIIQDEKYNKSYEIKREKIYNIEKYNQQIIRLNKKKNHTCH